MPVHIATEHENRLTVCTYTGVTGSADVRTFVESLLRGDHPAEYDGLHDFTEAREFVFEPSDYIDIAMRARATWPDQPARPKLTLVFGHDETFQPAFNAWKAFFFNDDSYRFLEFGSENEARAFLHRER